MSENEKSKEGVSRTVYVVTYQSGGILQMVEAFADYETAQDCVRESMSGENPVDWTAEEAGQDGDTYDERVYSWYKPGDDGDHYRIDKLDVRTKWPPDPEPEMHPAGGLETDKRPVGFVGMVDEDSLGQPILDKDFVRHDGAARIDAKFLRELGAFLRDVEILDSGTTPEESDMAEAQAYAAEIKRVLGDKRGDAR